MLKKYYILAKPGIIYGNSITAAAGFLLASRGIISLHLFFAMLIGLALVIGGSAVFNNYLDRGIDSKMERTKNRPSVTGDISKRNIIGYGSCLLLAGLLILYFYTNTLALLISLVGVVSYLALYTPLKRTTMHSPIVGSIAGAVPPLVGFCAVTGRLTTEALILFLIFVAWQMPHFYAIAMYKHEEYAAAGVPVLPLKRGVYRVKIYMLFYIIIFTIAAASLALFGFAGHIYLIVVLLLNFGWFGLGLQGFRPGIDEMRWARRMFLFSLIVVLVLSVALSLTALLP